MYSNTAYVFDLLKTRAQYSKYKRMSYKQEILKIFQEEGLVGFTRGYHAMIARDLPGFAFYFMIFDFNKRMLGVDALSLKVRKLNNE